MNDFIFYEESWNDKLIESRDLLKECLYFMNNVPNNEFSTKNNDKDHYKLCNKVEKFLNEIQKTKTFEKEV